MTRRAALLILADGRLPSGGYAHSGGLEPSVIDGRVPDAAALESFLQGRAATAGFVAACFAAAACEAVRSGHAGALSILDSELDARLPSPAVRGVSRALGRQLARALRGIYPGAIPAGLTQDAHQPLVYGAAAAAFTLGPRDAAQIVLHESVAGPAAAAAKVLRIDPFVVHSMLVRMAHRLDELGDEAARYTSVSPADLPALGSPLLDLAAERHRYSKVRLFAS
jgi:urease accessory protein